MRVELVEVTGFDLERKIVHATRPPHTPVEIPYDSLIVAGGAGQSYFGHDEMALHAPGMKTIDDALEIRRRVLGAFEMAETAADDAERATWLTIAIVGAGPTGCELAGQIRELATRSLGEQLPHVRPGIGPRAPPRRRQGAAGHVRRQPRPARRPRSSRASASSCAWERVSPASTAPASTSPRPTAPPNASPPTPCCGPPGVQASPLAAALGEATGAAVDRSGRVSVLPDLTLPGHPEVFAVGDMVSVNKLPGVCEVAMQGGLHAANTIVRRLSGEPHAKPFKYRDLGSVAAIGRYRAICSVKGIRLSGFPAWVVWMFVHLAFLNGFGNRFSTWLRWVRWLLGHRRSERVFSVAHTGGDLSTPASVLAMIEPSPYPAVASDST